jgi:hypothetical protein
MECAHTPLVSTDGPIQRCPPGRILTIPLANIFILSNQLQNNSMKELGKEGKVLLIMQGTTNAFVKEQVTTN